MEIKRVLIPRASEGETLVRKLGHAVLLQWENLSPETRKILGEQASLVQLLGAAERDFDEVTAALSEPRSWPNLRAVN
jgi:hypothetical protein